jgi:pSer/pThr/pTyr-binding forkhead associated (FHA) protein
LYPQPTSPQFPGIAVFAQLIPAAGGDPITIDQDITVVGRQSEHCDVVLSRKSVSKIHCVIVRTDGLLFVRDLDSTNGTKVNGQRIIRGALLPGDQLAFAGDKFKVHLGPSEDSPVSPIARTENLDELPSVTSEPFDDPTRRAMSDQSAGQGSAEDLVE